MNKGGTIMGCGYTIMYYLIPKKFILYIIYYLLPYYLYHLTIFLILYPQVFA